LPAIWELKECYDAAKVVNEVLGDSNGFLTYPNYNNPNNQSNFDQSDYWSSTEGSIYYGSQDGYFGAHSLSFNNGNSFSNSGSFYGGKTAFLSVRAVRKF
jgi:hypothetical protein